MGSTHATHQIKRKQGYKYADVDEKTGSQHAPTTWKKRRKRHTGALGLLVLRAAALCALNVCRDRIIRFRIVAKIRVVEQKSDGEQFKGKEILLNGAGPLQGWSPNRRAPPLLISRNTSPQTRNHSPRTEGRMTSQCAGEGACQASPHPASDRSQTQRGGGGLGMQCRTPRFAVQSFVLWHRLWHSRQAVTVGRRQRRAGSKEKQWCAVWWGI